jgi:hypothetical protein
MLSKECSLEKRALKLSVKDQLFALVASDFL